MLCVFTVLCSPWYNRTVWLGVKHQLTYLLTHCALLFIFCMADVEGGLCLHFHVLTWNVCVCVCVCVCFWTKVSAICCFLIFLSCFFAGIHLQDMTILDKQVCERDEWPGHLIVPCSLHRLRIYSARQMQNVAKKEWNLTLCHTFCAEAAKDIHMCRKKCHFTKLAKLY